MIQFGSISNAQQKSATIIPDGLYSITKIDTLEKEVDVLSSNEKAINFSKLFEDLNSKGYIRLIIDTTQYVPLELEKVPTTEQQTEAKKSPYYHLHPKLQTN